MVEQWKVCVYSCWWYGVATLALQSRHTGRYGSFTASQRQTTDGGAPYPFSGACSLGPSLLGTNYCPPSIKLYSGLASATESDSVNSSNKKNNTESEYDRTYRINLELAKLVTSAGEKRRGPNHRINCGRRALARFGALREPDTVSYNSLLSVLAKVSPSSVSGVAAAVRAQRILADMIHTNEAQVAANAAYYKQLAVVAVDMVQLGTTIDGAGAAAAPPALGSAPSIRVKPTVRTYGAVLDALARVGTESAASTCEQLLDDLHHRWVQQQYHIALEPNLICYNTLLQAWAKTGGSSGASNALRVLRDMPLDPDQISYNTALNAIARSGWDDAGAQAEAVLRTNMTHDDVWPNARTYSICMDAWGRCGRPDRAHALLDELVDLHRPHATDDNHHDDHRSALRPTAYAFGSVLHAYATSKDPYKAGHAQRVWNSMVAAGVRPNRITANAMLNVCATAATTTTVAETAPSPAQLIDTVERIYQAQLDDSTRGAGPDHVTFGTVLKACSHLSWVNPDFALHVFDEAIRRGQVSNGVLWQFRQAVPIDVYRDRVGMESTVWTNLPSPWTANVVERGRRSSSATSTRK